MSNVYQLVEQGRRLLAGNRPDLALGVFRQALSQEPDHAEAHALYAAALLNTGDTAQARREAEIALGLQPGDTYTQYVMACVLCHEGNFKKALVHVQHALQMNPQDELCHEKHVEILWRQGKARKALPACQEALALYPTNATLLNLRGVLEKQQGAKESSKSTFLELLALAPEDPFGLTNLGHLHLEQGEYPEALACFKGALRVQPDLEEARLGFVEALKASNRVYGTLLLLGNKWFQSSFLARAGMSLLVYLILVLGGTALLGLDVPPPAAAVGFWITLLALSSVRQLGNLMLLAHPVWRWALTEGERRTSLALLTVFGYLTAVALIAYFVPPQHTLSVLSTSILLFFFLAAPLIAVLRLTDRQRRIKAFITYIALWVTLFAVVVVIGAIVDVFAVDAFFMEVSTLVLLVWLGGVVYWLRLVWRA